MPRFCYHLTLPSFIYEYFLSFLHFLFTFCFVRHLMPIYKHWPLASPTHPTLMLGLAYMITLFETYSHTAFRNLLDLTPFVSIQPSLIESNQIVYLYAHGIIHSSRHLAFESHIKHDPLSLTIYILSLFLHYLTHPKFTPWVKTTSLRVQSSHSTLSTSTHHGPQTHSFNSAPPK